MHYLYYMQNIIFSSKFMLYYIYLKYEPSEVNKLARMIHFLFMSSTVTG